MKMGYIYTMEYCAATKKNEILPFVTTWMAPQDIMLSEIRQRKTNTEWFHYVWGLKKEMNKQNKNRLIETDTKGMFARGEGDGWKRWMGT